MSLRDQITSDMRDAMRAHDKEKLSALRMLLSSIKQKEVVYLPAQLSDEEIQKIVDEVVTSAGLSGPAAMGKAMGMIKPKVAGKADMGRVSARQDWLSKLEDFIKDVLRDAGSFKTVSIPAFSCESLILDRTVFY